MTTNSYNLFDSSSNKVKLIHVYPDEKEINRVFPSELAIISDINEFVGQISNFLGLIIKNGINGLVNLE